MNCKQCKSQFEITPEDKVFYDRVSPIIAGKKYPIPDPTFCPDCRQQRRLAFPNELHLYSGQCDLCHKKGLTQFPPHLKKPQYCRKCWHSDKWDSLKYGVDFDFTSPFFEQIENLRFRTPSLMLAQQGTLINCEYIHYAGSSKNCYLIMHADYCENCYYGYGFKHNKYCVDGFYNLHSEYCYDCVDVHKSYGLIGCQDCINCHSSFFLRDCVGCKNCFGCVGLRQKEYCFFNEELKKAQYEDKLKTIDLGSYSQYQQYKNNLQKSETNRVCKLFQGNNTENCLGNYLYNCKNTQYCFDCEDVENAKFCYQIVLGGRNIYDIFQFGTNLQESYEGMMIGEDAYHILFSSEPNISCNDIYYSFYLEACCDCFGCSDIHHKQYCILNKQYSKEEYEKLVPRIIDHMIKNNEWGEFFPANISLFGYNKTAAQMYYPLTKEEVIKKGWKWDDYETEVKAERIIPADRLPDNIKNIPDDILNWAIECEITKKPFKVTALELKFYRQQNIPIPHKHPDQRHLDRFYKRNPRKFWDRKCDKCASAIKTTYSPERPEKVYCENCYLKEVY